MMVSVTFRSKTTSLFCEYCFDRFYALDESYDRVRLNSNPRFPAEEEGSRKAEYKSYCRFNTFLGRVITEVSIFGERSGILELCRNRSYKRGQGGEGNEETKEKMAIAAV